MPPNSRDEVLPGSFSTKNGIQLSTPPPRDLQDKSKYMVRSVVGKILYRTDSACAAMQALGRFLVMNPYTTAAIYRWTSKGWVVYGLCALVGV
jgi:hypothetical protein